MVVRPWEEWCSSEEDKDEQRLMENILGKPDPPVMMEKALNLWS